MNQSIDYKKDSIEISFAAPRMHRISDDIELLLNGLAIHGVNITNLAISTKVNTTGNMKTNILHSEKLLNFYKVRKADNS